ncbi:hypothetical protein [Klebsiella aerogenes]|uniref:hypothetical protein n=1 Tax=Klebsiella aerogenes TaxID=548 RepID=UPI0021CB2679|nr:hypothetical protein [Klebsiella aerogenes]
MSVLHKALLWVVLAGCPLAGQAFTLGEGEPQGGSPHQYDIELNITGCQQKPRGRQNGSVHLEFRQLVCRGFSL